MEKAIGAYEARRKFGQLIEEAFYKHDHFVIERSGRAMAVIVPVDEYESWKRLAKERVFGMIEEVWEHNKDVPSEELDKDVHEAVKALNAERRSHKAS
jgi:prevent-host-death family protein